MYGLNLHKSQYRWKFEKLKKDSPDTGFIVHKYAVSSKI